MTAMFFGIQTDTDDFSFATPNDFRAAAYLKQFSDAETLSERVEQCFPLQRVVRVTHDADLGLRIAPHQTQPFPSALRFRVDVGGGRTVDPATRELGRSIESGRSMHLPGSGRVFAAAAVAPARAVASPRHTFFGRPRE